MNSELGCQSSAEEEIFMELLDCIRDVWMKMYSTACL